MLRPPGGRALGAAARMRCPVNPRVRSTIAALLGIVVAFASVGIIETLGHTVFPLPPGLDVTKPEQLRAYMQSIPSGALLFVLAAWVIAAFAGTAVACAIAKAHELRYAALVGGLILAATIANLVAIPHPGWMSVAAVIGIPMAAFLAGRQAQASHKKGAGRRP